MPSLDSFHADCEEVERLTFEISHLIDEFDIAQVEHHMSRRQMLMEQLAAYVETDLSDEFRTPFVNLLSIVAKQDAIDKQKCELLRDEYKDKLATQFKNNKAIKHYKSVK